jgi:hypothetical protein
MTLAETISSVRNGEREPFSDLIAYTAPGIWLAAALLCGEKIGTRMTEVYRGAEAKSDTLYSPSDLRMWLCGIAYPLLLEKKDAVLSMNGHTENEVFFRMLSLLPREERTAVLLLCGEGCTAIQCEQILGKPGIEIKRAMRRACGSLAEQAKQERIFAGDTINTEWIIAHMRTLREQKAQDSELFDTIARCVLDNTAFSERTTLSVSEKTAPRNYFQKLFRTKRFS